MIYDAVIVIAIWMIGTAVIVIFANRAIDSGNWWFQSYLLILAFVYFHISWSRIGQTLGMRTWRIRLDPGQEPFGLFRSLLRFLAGPVSLAPLGLGFVWVLLRADRRGWPDLVSSSRLVYSADHRSPANQ